MSSSKFVLIKPGVYDVVVSAETNAEVKKVFDLFNPKKLKLSCVMLDRDFGNLLVRKIVKDFLDSMAVSAEDHKVSLLNIYNDNIFYRVTVTNFDGQFDGYFYSLLEPV